METVHLMTVKSTEGWFCKPDKGEDLLAYRRTRYQTDPLGAIYMNYSASEDDENARRVHEEWLDNLVCQNPDGLDERFNRMVQIEPSILERVERLRIGDHGQAIEFLDEFGQLDARYAGREEDPWNPAGMPPPRERYIYASQFWATILQMKRALWLARVTTVDAEFIHEAVACVERKHRYLPGPLWAVKWPISLSPEWASYYSDSSDLWEKAVQDNPHVTNIVGPATYGTSLDRIVDPLPGIKNYLAERVDQELSKGLTHFYYSRLSSEYRELQIGTVDRHFWRHLADRILRVKSAKRCEGPGCTNLIRPKLDRGRFCGGTCRQNFNRERKAAKSVQGKGGTAE